MMPVLSRRSVLNASILGFAAGVLSRRTQAADGPATAAVPPNSIRNPRIPRVAGRFVNIYKPQPDVFTLPTVTTKPIDGNFTYTQGQTYPDWRTNDHTFIKGPGNRWHCFGITKPWLSGDNGHSGEGLCFHAVAPEGTFAQAMTFQSWKDQPKINVAGCGWAPTSIMIGQEYLLVGSQLGQAASADLTTWADRGRLKVKGGNRDPHILLHDGTYYLTRCDGNGVSVVTSRDFVTWSDPKTIYKPEKKSHQAESPSLVFYKGLFYLFWTLWDTQDDTTGGYCPRSYVHCSEVPDDFLGKPVLAEFTVHAPEIIQDEVGQWFMSTADHPHRGISVASLVWE